MVRDFLRRHRKKLLTLGFVTASIFYAYNYATSRLRDLSEKASDERQAKENLKRRFAQNQRDATLNVVAFLPELSGKILEELKVESITAELQAQKQGRSTQTSSVGDQGNSVGGPASMLDDTASIRSGFSDMTHATLHAGRRSKLELWNDIKITSITRIFSLYYCIALLVILTRVQLNLIGRSNYVNSVLSVIAEDGGARIRLRDATSDEEEEDAMTEETMLLNRRYMTFVWFLLNRGWRGVVQRVQVCVTEVFSRLEVREEMTLSQLRLLTSRVRSMIEFNGTGDDHHNWLAHVLPGRGSQEELDICKLASPELQSVPDDLRQLLDESAKEIDSHEAALLVSRCLDAGVTGLLEVKVRRAFGARDKLRVANILPVMTREAQYLAQTSETGDLVDGAYMDAINSIPELDGFSARLFTSFQLD